jgi:hypothetical protein
MEIIQIDGDTADIRVRASEVVVLANALNETREAIEVWEFSTRVGASPAEAEVLRQALVALLERLKVNRTAT